MKKPNLALTRPKVHFTPPVGWLNDPNGLMFWNGEYHLFYQHNPFGIDWGNTSWGHAVSRDLLHWEHLPVAIPVTDGVMAFSGSAVVDVHNTSGFGDGRHPPLVAAFTGFQPDSKIQDQRLAFSVDNGRSWTPYPHNPIIDLNSTEFRDPKLFWHAETASWIMAVALSAAQKVAIYRSPDLKTWTEASAFSFPIPAVGVWECPDLFPLQLANGERKWVLIVSIGSGLIKGGSGVRYFVGDFDGYQFTTDANEPGWLDYGPDFYAVQSWSNIPAGDGRCLILGWMSNLQYANVLPAETWRGMQSIPRELSLHQDEVGYHLKQQPIYELNAIKSLNSVLVDGVISGRERLESVLPSLPAAAMIELAPEDGAKIEIKLSNSHKKALIIRYNMALQTVSVDRAQTDFAAAHPAFAAEFAAPLLLEDGAIKLQLVIDSCSMELFGGNGRVTISTLFDFNPNDKTRLTISSKGGWVTLKVVNSCALRM